MKVFHVITSLDVGGAELVLARLVTSLKQKGVENTVICLLPEGAIAEQIKALNIPVISLGITSFFSSITGLYKLGFLIHKGRPDVVQSWLYHANILTSIATLLLPRTKVVWGIHSNQKVSPKKITSFLIKLGAMLSKLSPKKIIYVAQSSMSLHEQMGYSQRVSVVIPNGFDADVFTNCRLGQQSSFKEQYGIPEGKLVIGSVGRWHPDKGIDVMLQAIANLQKVYKNELFFIFAGKGCSDDNVEFHSFKQNCPIPNNILALGECKNIPDLLTTMDIFCLPSRTEAFPLALGEAMAAGVYCVATDVGDVKYLTGNLIDYAISGDCNSLQSVLESAITLSAAQRELLGKKLKDRVNVHFSEDNTVDSYLKIYNDLFSVSKKN